MLWGQLLNHSPKIKQQYTKIPGCDAFQTAAGYLLYKVTEARFRGRLNFRQAFRFIAHFFFYAYGATAAGCQGLF